MAVEYIPIIGIYEIRINVKRPDADVVKRECVMQKRTTMRPQSASPLVSAYGMLVGRCKNTREDEAVRVMLKFVLPLEKTNSKIAGQQRGRATGKAAPQLHCFAHARVPVRARNARRKRIRRAACKRCGAV